MLRSIIRSSTTGHRGGSAFRRVTVRTMAVGYEIPRRIKQKVVTAEDAVSLVRAGDTVAVSGFVCQGVPEGILRALAARYAETGQPHSLTLFFGGGPGDWDWRGLNHLALRGTETNGNAPSMLARTLGSHYGQVPKVAELALANEVEAWTLPMGSVSRMWRAQSTRSPGHLTTVGLGTCMVSMIRAHKNKHTHTHTYLFIYASFLTSFSSSPVPSYYIPSFFFIIVKHYFTGSRSRWWVCE